MTSTSSSVSSSSISGLARVALVEKDLLPHGDIDEVFALV